MVAVQNCIGQASMNFGGMLGLGLNVNFDEKNLFVWQIVGPNIISNATFGV